MRILWLDRAEADLDEAFDYVLARDPAAARRIHELIRNRVELLAEQPALGRPGRVSGTRELVIGGTPHIVAYMIDHAIDSVVILRALHGARRWPDAF